MKNILFSFLFCLNILMMNYVRAQQSGVIDSLKILPANPDTTSLIKIICYSSFASGPCSLDSSSFSINSFTVSVVANHQSGGFGAFCMSRDTIPLGNHFNPGNYKLIYKMRDSLNVVLDIDTIFFSIQSSNGINEYAIVSQIKIIPNPLTSSSILQLNTQVKNAEVVIYDMLGKEMVRKKMSGDKMEIEKGSLESGVYFVRVSSQERQWVGKMVVE